MRYGIIAIVAPARALTPLRRLLERLPRDFPVPILCLVDAPGMPPLAAMQAGIPVRVAENGEAIRPGYAYVAPPGRTPLLVEDQRISLAPYGPESTAMRPQDRFLASVGAQCGARVLCIVLGGFDGDGVGGARAIKDQGGTVLVLDRATAAHWGMAEPIVRAGGCDRVLGVEDVAEALHAWFAPCDILRSAQLRFELGELLDATLRSCGTHIGNVQLLDPQECLQVILHRGFEKPVLDRIPVVCASDDTCSGRALRLRQRVVIEDVEADAGYRPYLDVSRATGYRAVQSTPIFDHSARVLGVISTHFPAPHELREHEARMLDEVARQARPLIGRYYEGSGK